MEIWWLFDVPNESVHASEQSYAFSDLTFDNLDFITICRRLDYALRNVQSITPIDRSIPTKIYRKSFTSLDLTFIFL